MSPTRMRVWNSDTDKKYSPYKDGLIVIAIVNGYAIAVCSNHESRFMNGEIFSTITYKYWSNINDVITDNNSSLSPMHVAIIRKHIGMSIFRNKNTLEVTTSWTSNNTISEWEYCNSRDFGTSNQKWHDF